MRLVGAVLQAGGGGGAPAAEPPDRASLPLLQRPQKDDVNHLPDWRIVSHSCPNAFCFCFRTSTTNRTEPYSLAHCMSLMSVLYGWLACVKMEVCVPPCSPSVCLSVFTLLHLYCSCSCNLPACLMQHPTSRIHGCFKWGVVFYTDGLWLQD